MVASVFAAGQQLSADDLNVIVPIIRVKAADETVSSSVTPQNDDHLVCPVEANSTYLMWVYLLWTSISSVGDLRVDFTVPVDALIPVRNFFAQPSGTTTVDGTIATGGGTSAGGDDVRGTVSGALGGLIVGTVVVGGTAGDVTLRFAQGTSDANGVTLKQYSWMRLEKVFT